MIGWKSPLGRAAALVVRAVALAGSTPRRPLTHAERSILEPVFQGALDYQAMRIREGVRGLLNVSARAFVIEHATRASCGSATQCYVRRSGAIHPRRWESVMRERWLWFCLLVLNATFAAGCFRPIPCASDNDCPGSDYCDAQLKICLVASDGGLDGSVGGGMGGGIGGGGGTGGGMGGGDAGMGGGTGGGSVGCAPTLSCPDYEECQPTTDGGRCVSSNLSLTWTAPAAGSSFNGATIPGRVTVTKADGSTPRFTSLPVAGAMGGSFAVATGDFAGTLLLTGADGDKTFVAGWPDAGVASSLTIRKDTMSPTVSLFVESPPPRQPHELDLDGMNRWKKSESALVQTESTEDITIAPADFTTSAVTAVAANLCTRQCGMSRFCRCYSVDLTQHFLDGGIGAIPVALGAVQDAAGNFSAPTSSDVVVTRLKWSRDIGVGSNVPPTAVALAPNGAVIAGTSTGTAGSSYRLVTLSSDGVVLWERTSSTLSVTAGPVVGSRGAYVATSDGANSAISRIHLADGGVESTDCQNGSGLSIDGDLGLAGSGVGEVAVGVRSSSPPAVVSGTTNCFGATATGLSGRPAVVVTGDEAFVAGTASAPLFKFTAASTSPAPSGSASTMTLFPANLFAIGMTLVGGGGGGPTVGGVFGVVNSTGASLTGNTTNSTAGAPGGAAVVGGTSGSPLVFYGDNAGVLRRTPLTSLNPVVFGSAVASPAVATTLADRAALIGEGGWVYIVGNDGVIRATQWSGTGPGVGWQWTGLLPATTRISQLNLDVNRGPSAKRCGARQPGVLYVSSVQSTNARVWAVLVDSQGLDKNAPWPRHQHDPANTGNAQTPLTPWTCP